MVAACCYVAVLLSPRARGCAFAFFQRREGHAVDDEGRAQADRLKGDGARKTRDRALVGERAVERDVGVEVAA